jgi:hypothetical protein
LRIPQAIEAHAVIDTHINLHDRHDHATPN